MKLAFARTRMRNCALECQCGIDQRVQPMHTQYDRTSTLTLESGELVDRSLLLLYRKRYCCGSRCLGSRYESVDRLPARRARLSLPLALHRRRLLRIRQNGRCDHAPPPAPPEVVSFHGQSLMDSVELVSCCKSACWSSFQLLGRTPHSDDLIRRGGSIRRAQTSEAVSKTEGAVRKLEFTPHYQRECK